MKLTARPSGVHDDFSASLEGLPNGRTHPESSSNPSNDIYLQICLFKNETQVLSPVIFTKRLPSVKPDEQMSPATLMLESLCALVNRFYYKSTFDVTDFMRDILTAFESCKKPLDVKKSSRRTGGHSRKNQRIAKKEKTPKETTDDNSPPDKQLLTPNEDLNILDFLVSPLKTDFCVGNFTRKLDPQRTGRVRSRTLQFWEAV